MLKQVDYALLKSIVVGGLCRAPRVRSKQQWPVSKKCFGPIPKRLLRVTLPSIPPSADNRTVPWGSPSVHFSSLNGTLSTCCDSLDQVRDALDEIDSKLLDLLNQR